MKPFCAVGIVAILVSRLFYLGYV